MTLISGEGPAEGAPSALITGVLGQDGIYLARHLGAHGYRVVGTTRRPVDRAVTAAYLPGVDVRVHDHRDGPGFARLLEEVRPREVYNLSAFSSVGASWGQAEVAVETNAMAVLRMLESIVGYRERHGVAPRFFQPSSAEMFGAAEVLPHTEHTPHHPRSPYAVGKSFAHHLTVSYREAHDLFTTTAILYNHESPLRGLTFVTRKISRAVAEIALGRRESVTLGNLDVSRDWGFAGDYVRAMHAMTQHDSPQDFVIASGRSHTLSDVLEVAFATIGISDPTPYVSQDPALMRPADIPDLYGDPSKAREQLAWEPAIDFKQVIEHMVTVDIRRLESGVEHDPTYLDPIGG